MMIMFRKSGKNQSGAASMVIVIFMSIILTIVTIGFLRIALNEQRTSTDDDLSLRAFFAAESGIEDARRAIQEYLNGTLTDIQLNEDNCDVPTPTRYSAVLSPPEEFDTAYSCMLIDFTPETIRSELDSANETRQYKIVPVRQDSGAPSPIGEITLKWHIDAPQADDGDGDVGSGNFRSAANYTDLLPLGNWIGAGHPAMMQVHFISYPQSGLRRTDIIDATVLVAPGGGAAGAQRIFGGSGNSVNPATDGSVLPAQCSDNNGNYACEITFQMSNGAFPPSRGLQIRLTNSYQPTSIEMTMTSPSGDPLDFDDAQVVVDVTGRAGSVFRRVEAALDLSTPSLLPDFAVQSAEDICKDFSFTNDPADFIGQPNTSCTQL